MNQPTVTLPINESAFHALSMKARAEGVSLEAYLGSISRRGFNTPLSEVIASVFEDAANAADWNARNSA
jgi:hypothetical protein